MKKILIYYVLSSKKFVFKQNTWKIQDDLLLNYYKVYMNVDPVLRNMVDQIPVRDWL